MQHEFQALEKNQTWTLVPYDPGMKVVTNRWVFRLKHNPDGTVNRYKARLVARGFQQLPGLDFSETYSPVIKPSTIRIIFTLAALHAWPIHQVDVNNAFLHGTLNEQVFMQQPPGFINSSFPSHVCLLNKAIYGLRQAPRAWFDTLKDSLLQ